MSEIRKSPFKVDKIEDDPHAFGNRPKEVIACVEALFNNRHILISGPRGIGKSSLASQIQNLFKGDKTLAIRCEIKNKFENYLTCYYACGENITLISLVQDLIYRIEEQCKLVKSFRTSENKKFDASINLGVIKASLETEIISNRPATIATKFIEGLNIIYRALNEYTTYKGIIIQIDEIDRIGIDVNFGHFLKLIHEYIIQDKLNKINFILVGQKGIFSLLNEQDNSIDRVIRHIPLTKLDIDECKYILNYASSKKAFSPFTINPDAEEFILKLSSGFPYVIQLIGDSAFFSMNDINFMTIQDVFNGIEKILRSDKNEKYSSYFKNASPDERIILSTIAKYNSQELPVIIPLKHIFIENKKVFKEDIKIIGILNSLEKKGYIIKNDRKQICQFNDELFRIFLALQYWDEIEITQENVEIEIFNFSDPRMHKYLNSVKKGKMRKNWEFDRE